MPHTFFQELRPWKESESLLQTAKNHACKLCSVPLMQKYFALHARQAVRMYSSVYKNMQVLLQAVLALSVCHAIACYKLVKCSPIALWARLQPRNRTNARLAKQSGLLLIFPLGFPQLKLNDNGPLVSFIRLLFFQSKFQKRMTFNSTRKPPRWNFTILLMLRQQILLLSIR